MWCEVLSVSAICLTLEMVLRSLWPSPEHGLTKKLTFPFTLLPRFLWCFINWTTKVYYSCRPCFKTQDIYTVFLLSLNNGNPTGQLSFRTSAGQGTPMPDWWQHPSRPNKCEVSIKYFHVQTALTWAYFCNWNDLWQWGCASPMSHKAHISSVT